jgi:hypothetical protein
LKEALRKIDEAVDSFQSHYSLCHCVAKVVRDQRDVLTYGKEILQAKMRAGI